MIDHTRDPHPDSPLGADHDRRSDLERAVGDTNRAIENVEDKSAPDNEDGTGGVTNNQDNTAQ